MIVELINIGGAEGYFFNMHKYYKNDTDIILENLKSI